MIRFSASRFTAAIQAIESAKNLIRSETDQFVHTDALEALRTVTEVVGQHLTDLQLPFSLLQIHRINEYLQINPTDPPINNNLFRMLEQLSERISDELSNMYFHLIPANKAAYWDDCANKFGRLTLETFPLARSEVEEAGKCYAIGRNTAAAFHLMRVFEIGLKSIARPLGIPTDSNPSWDALLKKIKRAVEERHSGRDELDFYENLNLRMYAVKDVWRNPTMHVERVYLEEEVLEIFNHVSAFMKFLSTKVTERSLFPAIP